MAAIAAPGFDYFIRPAIISFAYAL